MDDSRTAPRLDVSVPSLTSRAHLTCQQRCKRLRGLPATSYQYFWYSHCV